METFPNTLSRDGAVLATSRVRLFLRIILALAFAGLFVAGALSVSKLFHLGLPCGAAHGCDKVNSHPSAYWFGFPVAYIGFLGYALLAGLALVRAGMSAARAKPIALVGYLVSAFGALTSVALQIYSLTVIQATCRWCLTSAVIMVTLLVFHALEYGDRVSEEVPTGTGEFKLASALAVICAVALTGFTLNLHKESYQAPIPVSEATLKTTPLVPDDAHIYGQKDAPITIVEFADLMCPVCQQDSPRVKEFVSKHPGRVRLVYRHFPIEQMHPMGMLAAGIAEAAQDQGKFWEFATAVMASGENMQTSDRVFEVAKSVGLDVDKAKATLADEKSPATQRLTRDVNAAGALGIYQTPTFLLQVKGQPTEAYGYPALMEALQNGRFKKLVDGL